MVGKRVEARKMAIQSLETAPSATLFHRPLAYISAEHLRQRVLCSVLDEIADEDGADRVKIDVALRFIKTSIGPHVMDEEEDLFPLLRRRAEPDDEINAILGQLSQEHASDDLDARLLVDGLPSFKTRKMPASQRASFRDLLRRFATNERRHLIVENAIVLPLAHARLTLADLDTLGRRMAARRGLSYPEKIDAE